MKSKYPQKINRTVKPIEKGKISMIEFRSDILENQSWLLNYCNGYIVSDCVTIQDLDTLVSM
jgi:hypothetical protein